MNYVNSVPSLPALTSDWHASTVMLYCFHHRGAVNYWLEYCCLLHSYVLLFVGTKTLDLSIGNLSMVVTLPLLQPIVLSSHVSSPGFNLLEGVGGKLLP